MTDIARERAKAHCRNYLMAQDAYLANGSPESEAQSSIAHQKWITTRREIGLSLFQAKTMEKEVKEELRNLDR